MTNARHLWVFATATLLACSDGGGGDTTDASTPDTGTADSSGEGGKIDGGSKDGGDAASDATVNDATSDATSSDGSTTDASDASDASTIDASDGGFDLGALSGLVLWLDAAKGVTKNSSGQVSKWADQSSSANDATQGTSSQEPVWSTSVINSLPALHFDPSASTYLYVKDSTSLQWGKNDFLVEMVLTFANDPSGSYPWPVMYEKWDGVGNVYLFGNDFMDSTTGMYASTQGNTEYVVTKTAYNDGKPRLYGIRRSGKDLEIRVQGTVAATFNPSYADVSGALGPVSIGGDFYNIGAYSIDGDIAEVVAVSGTISSTDLASLESYLMTKYGL